MKFSTAATTLYLCGKGSFKKAHAIAVAQWIDEVTASDSSSTTHAHLRRATKHDGVEANPKPETDAGILAGGGPPSTKMDAGILANAAQAKIRSLQTPDGTTPSEETVCDYLKGMAEHGMCVSFCEAKDCDEHPEYKSCQILKEKWQEKTYKERLPCETTTTTTPTEGTCDPSCEGSNACIGVVTSNVGCGSCNGDGACYMTGTATIYDGSCNNFRACSYVSATIYDGSCNGEEACTYASGGVGANSCNGFRSCYESLDYIDRDSCNNPNECTSQPQ